MAKTKQQKKEILENLKNNINKSRSIVFANFDKLAVKDNEKLRKKLKLENSEYYVAKKTLLNLAFQGEKIDNLNVKEMEGKIAAVFGYEDEVAPARIINEFIKENNAKDEKINFKGGILENKFISPEKVIELAKLPGKQDLYAKIIGSINAPASGLVNALAGNLRNLVFILKALEEKKSNS